MAHSLVCSSFRLAHVCMYHDMFVAYIIMFQHALACSGFMHVCTYHSMFVAHNMFQHALECSSFRLAHVSRLHVIYPIAHT